MTPENQKFKVLNDEIIVNVFVGNKQRNVSLNSLQEFLCCIQLYFKS